MKKTLSPIVAGIVAVIIFLGVINIARLSGFWFVHQEDKSDKKPPVENTKPPTQTQPKTSTVDSMKLEDYCWQKRIAIGCATRMLDVKAEDTTKTIEEIAKMKGVSTSAVIRSIGECNEEDEEHEEDNESEGHESEDGD